MISGCSHEKRNKHGKDRKGNQRWKCRTCGVTITDNDCRRPLGDMRISIDDAATVLNLLLEGMSIRACERITGMNRDTICDLVVVAGESIEAFMRRTIVDVEAEEIQLDEIWDFVAMKSRTKERRNNHDPDTGDVWTWIGLDANSKMVLAHATGLRDHATCNELLTQLSKATTGPCQVTSDGLRLYTLNVPFAMGSRAAFAQLVKSYSSSQSETRYSPATITSIEKIPRLGNPDEDKISTSYVERFNLSLRMHVRRFTRLTNAHSKSRRHHAAMVSLFVGWYNFCRPNQALGKKVSPAMAGGLADSVWKIKDLLKNAVE